MKPLSQERAPIYEALDSFQKMRVVPFDVPGHKRGRGNPELAALLGEQCVRMDVNSMKPLDNLLPSRSRSSARLRMSGCRGLRRSARLPDGRRHDVGGAEHGAVGCGARRKDSSFPETSTAVLWGRWFCAVPFRSTSTRPATIVWAFRSA